MMQNIDFERIYLLLGIEPEDGWEVARTAYRRRMQQLHPDKLRGLRADQRDAVMQRFLEVQSGFEELRRFHRAFGALPPRPVDRPPAPESVAATARAPEARPRGEPGPARGAGREGGALPPASRAGATGGDGPDRRGRAARPRRWRRRALVVLVGAVVAGTILTLRDADRIDLPGSLPGPLRQGVKPAPTIEAMPRRPTAGELVDLLGQPDRVVGDTWIYGRSRFEVVDGRVRSWGKSPRERSPLGSRGLSDDLRREFTAEPVRAKFRIGSHKAEVLAIQGPPLRATDTRWDYGVSTVFFEHAAVVGWYHSRLDPLRVEGPPGHVGGSDHQSSRD